MTAWREVEYWCVEERREFENLGGEILITLSVLLQKNLVTFRGSFRIKNLEVHLGELYDSLK
jgi:hypothetical protein